MNNRVRVGKIRPPDGEILAELGKIQALCKLIAGGLHLHCGMCLRNHHARDRDVERFGDAVADKHHRPYLPKAFGVRQARTWPMRRHHLLTQFHKGVRGQRADFPPPCRLTSIRPSAV